MGRLVLCILLSVLVFFISCTDSESVSSDSSEYVYTGAISGNDLIVDSYDTTFFYRVKIIVGSTIDTTFRDTVITNTYSESGVIYNLTHQKWNTIIISKDTLGDISMRRIQSTTYTTITWAEPTKTEDWIGEITFISTGTSYGFEPQAEEWLDHSLFVRTPTIDIFDTTDGFSISTDPVNTLGGYNYNYVLRLTRLNQ